MHVFSGIQALTERLSKIPQQCEIQFRTRIQFCSERVQYSRTDFGSLKQHVGKPGFELGLPKEALDSILLHHSSQFRKMSCSRGTFRMDVDHPDSHQVKTFFQVGVGRMKNGERFLLQGIQVLLQMLIEPFELLLQEFGILLIPSCVFRISFCQFLTDPLYHPDRIPGIQPKMRVDEVPFIPA